MNSKSKKIVAISAASVGVLGVLLFGAQAVLTDDGNQGIFTFGREGTIDVSVSDVEVDDNTNINPGDCDPYLIKNASTRFGTEHEISFAVSNSGTKSIRTRQVITLSCVDEKHNTINPSVFMLSNLENDKYKEVLADGSTYVTHKYYLLDDGKRIEVTGSKAFYVDDKGVQTTLIGTVDAEPSAANIDKLKLSAQIIKVQYVIISDVLDGTSKTEGVAEIENKVQTTSQSYKFYLGMYHDALTNGFSDTTALAPNGKYYLAKGLSYDNKTQAISGTEVVKIIGGKFQDASMTAPDGKVYLADGTTEVTYVNMKYYQGSIQCPLDNNYYLEGATIDNITKVITGTRLSVTQVNGKNVYKNGNTEVSEDQIARWDTTGHVLSNAEKSLYVFKDDGSYEQVQENDIAKWVINSNGSVSDTMILHGVNSDKYVLASNQTSEVKLTDLAHFDSSFNLIANSEFEGYENSTVTVDVEIQAMQYRNTTNADWDDWTTYDSQHFEYGITADYAADANIAK